MYTAASTMPAVLLFALVVLYLIGIVHRSKDKNTIRQSMGIVLTPPKYYKPSMNSVHRSTDTIRCSKSFMECSLECKHRLWRYYCIHEYK